MKQITSSVRTPLTFIRTSIFFMLVVMIVGCGGSSVNPSDPNGFAVHAAATTAAVGDTVTLQATMATQDVTDQTTWTVSDSSIADVQSNIVHGKAPGTVNVSGTYKGTSRASATLTITASAPVITWPQPADVPAATVLGSTQLNATANVPGTFTYKPAAGTALQAGTQTLTATFTPTDSKTYSTATASRTINVTSSTSQPPTLTAVQISGTPGSVQTGQAVQLVATAIYSDNSFAVVTSTATWTSSNRPVASVSSAGQVTGVAAGTAQITASYNGVSSAPATINVSAKSLTLTAIQISGGSSVAASSSLQLKATGTYSDQTTQDITSSVSWASAQSSVATVQGGSVTGVAAGTTTITASLNGVSSAPATITVTAKTATLVSIQISGGSPLTTSSSVQLKATGTYSDQTTQDITSSVSWASSQSSVATVQGGGAVIGVGAGTTTITASLSGVTGSTSIQVTSGSVIQVDPSMAVSQIQSKINGSKIGDTINFAAGTYNMASNGSNPNGAALILAAGRTYTGPSSGSPAHLVGTGFYPLMYFTGIGVTIEYFTFDNGMLWLEDLSTVTVNSNTFENIDCASNQYTRAIYVAGGLNNSDISYNTFQNIGQTCNSQYQDNLAADGIAMFGFHNLTITHNTFDKVYEGIAIAIDASNEFDGAGSHFNNNTFTGIHRMAIELLGLSTNPSGLEVAYNNYSNALNPWALTFGLSLTAGQNMIVHDNVMNGNNNQPGYVPYGIEIAGVNSKAYNNIIEGYWGWGMSIGNTSSISITNNYFCGPTMNSAPNSGSAPVQGNASGFISWQGNAGSGAFTGNTTSSALTCGQ